MKENYKVYSYGEDLTLIEIFEKEINKKKYTLLLQQQAPGLLLVGYFENKDLRIVDNDLLASELLKVFLQDKECYDNLKPFINEVKKAFKSGK